MRYWVDGSKVRAFDLGSFNELAFCRDGPMLYNKHDLYVGLSLKTLGEYCFEERRVLQSLVEPHSVVIEVGANIGAHTIHLAKRTKQIFAFEPQRMMFQLLCANAALNGLINVHAVQCAVGSEVGTTTVPLLLPDVPNNFGAMSLVEMPEDAYGEMCAVTTLDAYSYPGLAGPIALIKIDVEGMEKQVLDGAKALIRDARPFIYLENDRKKKSDELMNAIKDLDYRMYWHLPMLYNKDNYFGGEDPFPNVVSVNMLCVPSESTVQVGLREGLPAPLQRG